MLQAESAARRNYVVGVLTGLSFMEMVVALKEHTSAWTVVSWAFVGFGSLLLAKYVDMRARKYDQLIQRLVSSADKLSTTILESKPSAVPVSRGDPN